MRKNIKRKFITMATALMFSASVLGHGAGVSYADDPTTEQKGGSSGGTTEEASTEAGGVKADVLEDDHGRISFWEWKRIKTNEEMTEVFKDNQFHACMFVYGDNHSTASADGKNVNKRYDLSFISTYNDRSHVFLPREKPGESSTSYLGKYDKLVDIEGDEYDNFIKKYFGSKAKGESDPLYYAFDQHNTMFFKLDEDGHGDDPDYGMESVIVDPETKAPVDKFFTTGGCMGVPFVKATEIKDGYLSRAIIAISDGSAKDNPADMSYLAFGDRASSDHAYIYSAYGSVEGEPTIHMTDYYPLFDDAAKSHCYSIYQIQEKYKDKKLFPDGLFIIAGNDAGAHTLAARNGWLIPVSTSYGVDELAFARIMTVTGKLNLNNDDTAAFDYITSNNTFKNIFLLYVGTQHVFASIKGEGGDKDTGEGGITTIGDGQMLIVGDATYMDQNNKPAKAEGIVLPEKSQIIVNKGGVLSIDGNFINNGQIICNGGTIIVKEGGCISPYRGTSEGVITMNGGDMIIMPGAKVYALADENESTTNFNPSSYMTYEENLAELAKRSYGDKLKVINGGNIINYGTLVATRAVVSKGSKIETRNGAYSIFGVALTDNSVLLRNIGISATMTRLKTYTLNVNVPAEIAVGTDIVKATGAHSAGIYAPGQYNGYTDPTGVADKGTVVAEKGGTFTSSNGTNMIEYIEREY